MIPYKLSLVFSYSILFAAVVGIWRYKKIMSEDRPFFYLIWVALFCEILSEICASLFQNNAPIGNFYVLMETLLTVWLYYNWRAAKLSKQFWILLGMICVIWIIDNLIANKLTHTNSFFRIAAAFIMVFLAIDRINHLITTERGSLIKNAYFLISVGIVIFFTYKAIIETFFLVQLPFSELFYTHLLIIMDYVNLFVNLIFGMAALWIPTRQKFTLPS